MSLTVSPYNPTQQSGVRSKNPPDLIIINRIPTTTDFAYLPGQLWVFPNDSYWGLLGFSAPNVANWIQLGGGTVAVAKLTGDGATIATPVAGNINVYGNTAPAATGLTFTGSAGLLELSGTLNVSHGGTGVATLAAHGVLVGQGTSNIVSVGPGNDGQTLIGNTGADPSFVAIGTKSGLTAHGVVVAEGAGAFAATAAGASGIPLIGQGAADPVFGTAIVAGGGTGDTSFTAYSVICGGTTSTGNLQNVSGVGTSGQVLTSNGAAALPTWQTSTTGTGVVLQKFTINGTYTPTAGMQFCVIECWGAGGGGAGTTSGPGCGGGGGAGGYSRLVASAATIGVSQAVTIGTPGSGGGGNGGSATATSVGILCVANGGSGGTVGTAIGRGGLGGTAGTGDIAAPGMAGFSGYVTGAAPFLAGSGGSTLVGAGGLGGASDAGGVGGAGSGFGSGGGGSSLGGGVTGGDGAPGFVVITEFL